MKSINKMQDLETDTHYKVLIVDDVPQNLQILGNILIEKNLDVSFANDGPLALSVVENNPPDLILLDVAMPGMNGFEVCKVLRENENTKEIPVIFLTAKADAESIVEGFKVGGQDYVTKPYNSQELLSRVMTQLDLRDKTEKLKAVNQILEQKVKERTMQLEKANQQLSRLNKAKDNFLGIVSHELKTPLNGILGFTSLLEKTEVSDKQKDLLKYLKDSAQRLEKLSDISLSITWLQVKGADIKKTLHPLFQIITDAILTLQQKASSKNIELINKVEDRHLVVNGEMELISNCFQYIIDNSIKFSKADTTITINARKEENWSVVSFEDNGRGFSEDALAYLYELFAVDDITHHSEGLGLSLRAVKLIMDAHSGKVVVKNKPSGGAIVSLYFQNF